MLLGIVDMIQHIASILYSVAICGLAIFAIHACALTVLSILSHLKRPSSEQNNTLTSWPDVTVQIPLRNERYIVNRIIHHAAHLDYPRDRLHLLVLDDSDDGTMEAADSQITRLRKAGVDISVIHRDQPVGYKAGALRAAGEVSQGAYTAIFDADFVPGSDFLKRTIPILVTHPEVAMVQAKWHHLNSQLNLVTRAQALALDAHFNIDQPARNWAGLPMNFNGTAGVWRNVAICDAGNWTTDTLTEDLDLSYRAQLKGWRMMYVPSVIVGEELPPLLGAVKTQQYRWAKGAAQCLRKLALSILKSKKLNPVQKVFSLLHLSGYFSQMLMVITLFTGVILTLLPGRTPPAWLGSLSVLLTLLPALYYLVSQLLQTQQSKAPPLGGFFYYPALIALGLCSSLDISVALVDGLLHNGGEFIRTDKFNADGATRLIRKQNTRSYPLVSVYEVILLLFALVGVLASTRTQNYDFLPLSIAYVVSIVSMKILDFYLGHKISAERKKRSP